MVRRVVDNFLFQNSYSQPMFEPSPVNRKSISSFLLTVNEDLAFVLGQ